MRFGQRRVEVQGLLERGDRLRQAARALEHAAGEVVQRGDVATPANRLVDQLERFVMAALAAQQRGQPGEGLDVAGILRDGLAAGRFEGGFVGVVGQHGQLGDRVQRRVAEATRGALPLDLVGMRRGLRRRGGAIKGGIERALEGAAEQTVGGGDRRVGGHGIPLKRCRERYPGFACVSAGEECARV